MTGEEGSTQVRNRASWIWNPGYPSTNQCVCGDASPGK